MPTYTTALTVEDAVAALAAGARPIAGGTDLVVGARQGKKRLPEALVGIHRIAGLDQIESDGTSVHIGALVTHQALVTHPLIQGSFAGLADASAIVGSHATRANGTIGGNVMNASPAMDTGAPLLCHGAVALLQRASGTRRVVLSDLWTGPGATSASADELLTGLELPLPPPNTASAYVRLQYRRQMEIAIVGAGAYVAIAGGKVAEARIAITALAPVIHRVEAAEEALVGTDGNPTAVGVAAEAAAAAARPISDVRGSAQYRRAMAAVVTRRALDTALRRARGQVVGVPASDSTFGAT